MISVHTNHQGQIRIVNVDETNAFLTLNLFRDRNAGVN